MCGRIWETRDFWRRVLVGDVGPVCLTSEKSTSVEGRGDSGEGYRYSSDEIEVDDEDGRVEVSILRLGVPPTRLMKFGRCRDSYMLLLSLAYLVLVTAFPREAIDQNLQKCSVTTYCWNVSVAMVVD